MKQRGFELVSTESDVTLSQMQHVMAGYDLKASQDMHISPGSIVLVPTGVKAYMVQLKKCFYLFDRSSNPCKRDCFD